MSTYSESSFKVRSAGSWEEIDFQQTTGIRLPSRLPSHYVQSYFGNFDNAERTLFAVAALLRRTDKIVAALTTSTLSRCRIILRKTQIAPAVFDLDLEVEEDEVELQLEISNTCTYPLSTRGFGIKSVYQDRVTIHQKGDK